MKTENTIEVSDISKSFKIYYDKGNTLKEKLLFSKRRKYEERKILDSISFQVKKGEAIGLIGQNGCGKSTTLKLLSRIMYPDIGNIQMHGRVSSLLELGAGFHPDMSGRENIYINASIFGLNRKEIDNRIDNIIDFSELMEFIDNPVRTYSSGMYMRLAFSVAINVDADILLIDEILAVGDANFQAKCFAKLKKIKANGTTIVIVSHSLSQIEQICDRTIWICNGRIKEEGKPRDVHPKYMDYIMNVTNISKGMAIENEENVEMKIEKSDESKEKKESKDELGNKDVEIVWAEIRKYGSKKKTKDFFVGDKIELVIEYKRNNKEINASEFGFHFFREDGIDCYGTNTIIDKLPKVKMKPSGQVIVVIEKLLLLKGHYTVDLAFHNEYGLTYHHVFSAIEIDVKSKKEEVGLTRLEHKWIYDEMQEDNSDT